MRHIRSILLFLVFVLVALGLVVLASASDPIGYEKHGDRLYFLYRQVTWLGIGAVAALACSFVDYRLLMMPIGRRRYPWLMIVSYCAVVLMMIAVLFMEATKGSHRWFTFGSVKFQPGEAGKMVAVLASAAWVSFCGWRLGKGKYAFFAGATVAVLSGLALCEPDFGTCVVIGVAGAGVLVIGGYKFWHTCVFALLAILAIAVAFVCTPNRMRRLANYRENKARLAEASGAKGKSARDDGNWQLNMATVSFAKAVNAHRIPEGAEPSVAGESGGGLFRRDGFTDGWLQDALLGAGFKESRQKRRYLPEDHTDFIFAIGAEELGFLFSIIVLCLYTGIFICGCVIGYHAVDPFGKCVALGISFLIYFQALFNIGVVCGAFPPKGIALPFMSYGGTNLLCNLLEIGMLFSVARQISLQNSLKKSKIAHVFIN